MVRQNRIEVQAFSFGAPAYSSGVPSRRIVSTHLPKFINEVYNTLPLCQNCCLILSTRRGAVHVVIE